METKSRDDPSIVRLTPKTRCSDPESTQSTSMRLHMIWLVYSVHFQSSQVRVKNKNIRNHHLVMLPGTLVLLSPPCPTLPAEPRSASWASAASSAGSTGAGAAGRPLARPLAGRSRLGAAVLGLASGAVSRSLDRRCEHRRLLFSKAETGAALDCVSRVMSPRTHLRFLVGR